MASSVSFPGPITVRHDGQTQEHQRADDRSPWGTPKNPRPARMAINSVISVRKLPMPRSIMENQPQNGPKSGRRSIPRGRDAWRIPDAWSSLGTDDGHAKRKHDEGKEETNSKPRARRGVGNHAGPSFSPSMTRIPGPTSSHSRRNLEKVPRWARARTRARGRAHDQRLSCVNNDVCLGDSLRLRPR